ncbi:MAG: glycosyltransferase [Lentisphaeria bacterium]|nr:glycosyltransferase [Lentisphaeria bacterium]
MTKYSFVIPCYGSEGTIEKVTGEITKKMSERPEMDHEIICVNDCSPDAVWSVLMHLHERDPRIKLLNLSKNMNRPGAVMAGLNHASGDIVIVMDDDGQCPMDRLWDLLEPLSKGFDVSMAKYPERKQSLFKDFGTWVNKKMTQMVLKRPADLEFTNFMAMKKYIVRELVRYPHPYPYLTGLLLRTTKYMTNVEMEERNRFCGRTTFTFLKMVSLWMNGLTAFSILPLRLATYTGMAIAGGGFIFGLVILIRKLVFPESIDPGYSSIIVALFVFSGLIMLLLGMLGEYIGRIYICINHSPQFLVRDAVGFETENEKHE